MSVTLIKDVVITTTPGTPGTAGSPGTAPTPAYCVTTTKTTPTYTYQLVELPLAPGETQVQYQMFAVAGAPVVSTSTVCYPATAGVAPTAPIAGTAGTTQQQFNLGWNGGARSIASLLASGTASFSASAGMVGGVVGLDSGAVEFSYGGAKHALYFRNNLVSVLENGVLRTGAVPYLAADVFRIERSGPTVRYYQNTTLLHTSAAPSYGTQYLEASLYSGGDTVLNASLTDVTTVGYGSGTAVLAPLAARGGIAGSSGTAVLAPLTSAGTGYAQQGGVAVLAPLGAIGSQGSYAMGTATLAPLDSLGEAGIAGSAPTYALGVAALAAVGSAGYGVTAGNTISPSTSLGDSASGWPEHVWAGSVVVIVSGTGAGQTREIADNTGQALLINTPWVTVPDASSVYEIRDALGTVLAAGTVTPGGGRMAPVASLGANYAYAGGVAALAPVTSVGVALRNWAAEPHVAGVVLARGPLGAASALALHDFTGQLGDALSYFVLDLVSEVATVRVPMSSWQATLQTGSSNYVQCVVPACEPWLDVLNAATEFVISRTAVLATGAVVEYVMARTPAEQLQFSHGPQRYTCTLSGYSDAFGEVADPSAAFDRVLTVVRSVSSGSGGLRVRCAMDWLLRPGQRAFVQGTPFVARFINYYAPSNFDAYMDVGAA